MILKVKATHFPIIVQRSQGQSAILLQQMVNEDGVEVFELTSDDEGRQYFSTMQDALDHLCSKIVEEMTEIPGAIAKPEEAEVE